MTGDASIPGDAERDFARLETASGDDKMTELQALIDNSADRCFRVPPALGHRVNLTKARLPDMWLAGAQMSQADLREAHLRGAMLGGADLSEALLEMTDLRDADLVGARLQRAEMGECQLRNALLEDCVLTDASMRFCDLRSSTLERADLCGVDLWGAHLDAVQAEGAAFRNATLGESSAKGANFSDADFSGASLSRVDFEGSLFVRAQFENVRFFNVGMRNVSFAEAQLVNVDLSTCTLEGSRFAGAWLERTRVRREQLGDAIGEERSGDWRTAASGYFALERNFLSLGDHDAARWAYLKRRRMEKRASYANAAHAARNGHLLDAVRSGTIGVGAELAQSMCDYGESIVRVFAAIAIVFFAFAVLYGATGSVIAVASVGGKNAVTYRALDLLTFSALAMTTYATPIGLEPANVGVEMLRGVEALFAIFLTGLLGFVAGNRIHR